MFFKGVLFVLALLPPLLAGGLFVSKKDSHISLFRLSEMYLLGQFFLWAIFQVLAVILIRLKCPFSSLYYSFCAITACASICGIICTIKRKPRVSISLPKSPIIWITLIITIGIISYQLIMYIFGLHLDEDDARWIAESNDALVHGTMFLNNPSTGTYIGNFVGDMVRDSISPWPMYIAVLSRFVNIRPAIMAHTIYAPVLLIIGYMAHYRVSIHIFEKDYERLFYVLAVSVITLFFYGNSDTEAAFSLIRIWQGKAVVAGVAIPAIFSQIIAILHNDTTGNWLILAMLGCASCLLSGMGVVISLVMIGGYGLYIIATGKWKRIPIWILTLLPSGIFEIIQQKLMHG